MLGCTSTTMLLGSSAAQACNLEPFIGSVCLVAFTFCPRGFAEANGQIMSIAQNTALFSLLGTTYGGNGQTTFALPDLRGRVPVGVGQGPGLSSVDQGEVTGSETVTLNAQQLPAHTHSAQLKANSANGNTDSPSGAALAKLPRSNIYASAGTVDTNMTSNAITVSPAGGSQPVGIRNPMLGLRYCIAIEGIFPSRN
ncbi:MAG TPA: tail fiber protein [Burkholderiaceae bacterium]